MRAILEAEETRQRGMIANFHVVRGNEDVVMHTSSFYYVALVCSFFRNIHPAHERLTQVEFPKH